MDTKKQEIAAKMTVKFPELVGQTTKLHRWKYVRQLEH